MPRVVILIYILLNVCIPSRVLLHAQQRIERSDSDDGKNPPTYGKKRQKKRAHSDESIKKIPEVVVEDKKKKHDDEPEEKATISSAFSARGSSFKTKINRYHDTGQSLSDILSFENGIQIQKRGTENNLSALSIWGAPFKQTVIYLNGFPLQNEYYGIINLSGFPAFSIDRIEIYKDSSPVLFGKPAGSGAVNLISDRKYSGRKEVLLNFEHSSFDTRGLSGLLRFPWPGSKESYANLFLHYKSSSGDYPFLNNNQTPVYNTEDDFEDRRLNNEFYHIEENLNLQLKAAARHEFFLLQRLYYKKGGIPGSESLPLEKTEREQLDSQIQLLYTAKKLFGPFSQFQWRNQFNINRKNIRDPELELSLGGDKLEENYREFSSIAGSEIYFWRQKLSFSVSVYRKSFNNELSNEIHYANEEKQIFSTKESFALWDSYFRLADEIYLITSNNLNLSLNVEVNRYVPFSGPLLNSEKLEEKDFWSYNSGLALSLYRSLTLKANAGINSRFPTFQELYGDSGLILANTSLLPERTTSWSTGISSNNFTLDISPHNAMLFAFEVVYYDRDYRDLILLTQNSQNTALFVNLSRARVRGMEFSLNTGLNRIVSLNLRYNYQLSKNLSPEPYYYEKDLPYQPRHNYGMRLNIHQSISLLHLSLWSEYQASSYSWLDRANSFPNYVRYRELWNAGLIIKVKKYLDPSVAFTIKNLLDRDMEDVAGYPLPRRQYSLIFSLRFR